MITEILLIVSVGLNIFLLYKQVPIWWTYCKEIKVDKELEKEIAEMETIGNDEFLNKLKKEITKLFFTLKQVKHIQFHGNLDDLIVITTLKSRHYNSRRSLYKKQLQIHDIVPDVNIEFNVIFDNKND